MVAEACSATSEKFYRGAARMPRLGTSAIPDGLKYKSFQKLGMVQTQSELGLLVIAISGDSRLSAYAVSRCFNCSTAIDFNTLAA